MKTSNLILDIIVFLYVVLFVYAASSKLLDYDLFQAQIGKSPLIMGYADIVAWFIPAIEILISFSLLIPRLQLIALYASFTLMFMFTAYIAFILTFSPYVPCSCGGILNNLGWTEHLIFNGVFTLMAAWGVTLHERASKNQSAPVVDVVR